MNFALNPWNPNFKFESVQVYFKVIMAVFRLTTERILISVNSTTTEVKRMIFGIHSG